jgi:hypothetical protein
LRIKTGVNTYVFGTLVIGLLLFPVSMFAQAPMFDIESAGAPSSGQFYNIFQDEVTKLNANNSEQTSEANSSNPSQGKVTSYLSKYLGQTVLITNDKKIVIEKGVVRELVIGEEGYYFSVNDDIKVKIIFEGYQRVKSYVEQRNARYGDRIQRNNYLSNRLLLEQKMSSVADSIYSGDSSAMASNSVSGFNNPINGEVEIGLVEYYDAASSMKKHGMVYMVNEKLRLRDGTPLSIRFEKVEA